MNDPLLKNKRELTRGQLAKITKLNIETLRYYEHRGLLPKPPRNFSNYRIYNEDSVRCIHFIKCVQQLRFTLSEIKELLEIRSDRMKSCSDIYAILEHKILELTRESHSINDVLTTLNNITSKYDSYHSIEEKEQFLEALEHWNSR